jgi:hypothetical protein
MLVSIITENILYSGSKHSWNKKHADHVLCWPVSCKASSIFPPHVLGVFVGTILGVLLPGITAEVVEVAFVVAIPIFLTELQELV